MAEQLNGHVEPSKKRGGYTRIAKAINYDNWSDRLVAEMGNRTIDTRRVRSIFKCSGNAARKLIDHACRGGKLTKTGRNVFKVAGSAQKPSPEPQKSPKSGRLTPIDALTRLIDVHDDGPMRNALIEGRDMLQKIQALVQRS